MKIKFYFSFRFLPRPAIVVGYRIPNERLTNDGYGVGGGVVLQRARSSHSDKTLRSISGGARQSAEFLLSFVFWKSRTVNKQARGFLHRVSPYFPATWASPGNISGKGVTKSKTEKK